MRSSVLLMILGSMCFTVMVGLVKTVRADLSATEVILWRAVVAVTLLTLLLRPPSFRIGNRKVFAVRLGLGFTTMLCFYGAAKGLALTDLTLISKLQPILIAVVAPLVLGAGERTGPSLWVILALGLAGTGLILAPELAVGSPYALLAVGGAVSSTGAHLALRRLGSRESTRAIVFWFQAGLLGAALAVLLAGGRLPTLPERSLWAPLVGVGVTATLGQLLMTRAYSGERAAVVAAASYTTPLWAVLGDVLVFGIAPGVHAYAGGALVVAAGLWLLRGSGGEGAS